MSSPLYIAFTMDCERIAAESPPGGPASWALSERAIRGYCSRLLDHGYTPTLFLVPECADQHAALLADLAQQGVELGLHVHPQSLGDHRYGRYLGEYAPSEQHEILSLATEMVTSAIGFRPVSFRPGNFSASNATYGLLYDLGFRQGSVSDPGRRSPQYAAEWEGAYPDPHYVDRLDKLRAGSLPFLEVPVTTDPERRHPNGFPYELRIESGSFETWHRPIIESHLRRFEQTLSPAADSTQHPTELSPTRALCVFTHNCFAYDRTDDPKTVTLQQMLDDLAHLGGDQALYPGSLRAIHEHIQARLT